eukprot:9754806-Lingulodinium_polyedra.AAC.1
MDRVVAKSLRGSVESLQQQVGMSRGVGSWCKKICRLRDGAKGCILLASAIEVSRVSSSCGARGSYFAGCLTLAARREISLRAEVDEKSWEA